MRRGKTVTRRRRGEKIVLWSRVQQQWRLHIYKKSEEHKWMGYPALLTSRKFDLRLTAVKIFYKEAKNPSMGDWGILLRFQECWQPENLPLLWSSGLREGGVARFQNKGVISTSDCRTWLPQKMEVYHVNLDLAFIGGSFVPLFFENIFYI